MAQYLNMIENVSAASAVPTFNIYQQIYSVLNWCDHFHVILLLNIHKYDNVVIHIDIGLNPIWVILYIFLSNGSLNVSYFLFYHGL